YVLDLGADQVVDYNAQDFTRLVSGCDAVFDTVGGEVAHKSFAVLKPGGRAAFIASGVEAPKPVRGDVVSLRPPVERSRGAMERIAGLIETRAVRPPAIKVYSLAQAVEAHRLSESRHFRGKLVFQVPCTELKCAKLDVHGAPATSPTVTRTNCGNKADVWSFRKIETHTNLIIRPPSYFRRMARAISIDSQIKAIRNADGTGDD